MVSYVNNKFNIMGDKRKREEEEELEEDHTLSSKSELFTHHAINRMDAHFANLYESKLKTKIHIFENYISKGVTNYIFTNCYLFVTNNFIITF